MFELTNRQTMKPYISLSEISADLSDGKITCAELVAGYLQRIQQTRHLNAYVEVFADEAIARAAELDKKYLAAPETVGRLFGAVLSIKDVLCYEGHKVSAASAILQNFTSVYSATAVARLLAQDAIIIGRTNCDQFAMGSTNENSVYGPVLNAGNEAKIPGGSSGGAAVSVQAFTCLAALGSDTGGSVRQPAAFCSLIGFKPTYGRISRFGLLAYGSSLDQIGVVSHSVEDAALLLETMAGADDYDATASSRAVPAYLKLLEAEAARVPPYRIAYFKEAVHQEGLEKEIKAATLAAIDKIRQAGHIVESVDFEYLDFMVPAYYVLSTAEASSNLSRYDGVRFGLRAKGAKTLEETYKKTRTEGFSEEVKRRIMLGAFVLSAGYYDAYYTKAQKVRRLIADRTGAIFRDYDFIMTPASPAPAWNIGEKTDDPVAMYLADVFTVQANMTGAPALCLPIGKHSEGTGIGLQFMAPGFEDAKLLIFGNKIKKIFASV